MNEQTIILPRDGYGMELDGAVVVSRRVIDMIDRELRGA